MQRRVEGHRRGVTALEFIVAVAILAIASTLVIGGFSRFRRSAELNRAAEDAISLLSDARARTLGSRNDLTYGVRFDANRMALFSVPYTEVEAIPLESDVVISAVANLPGCSGLPCDVTFVRLTGAVANGGASAGTVTFRSVSESARTRTLTIQPTGVFSL